MNDEKNDHSASRQPMIEAIGLSKFYGPFAAARDVSFEVGEGELVAFLGPNGAGKSTTMKMLTGYIAASEGEARIAGHNMMEDRIEGSRRLGYLPENGPLYPEMTPHSMLSFFADARGMSSAQKKDRIEAVVDICDLSTVLYKPISKLSKGFQAASRDEPSIAARTGRTDFGRTNGRVGPEPNTRSSQDDASAE